MFASKTTTILRSTALAGALTLCAATTASAGEIRMLINQSPWLNSFITMVNAYEQESGNKIDLDVTPYGGMVEKTRNSLRSGTGQYDLIALNAAALAEFYGGGYLEPLDKIDPNFKIGPNILSFNHSTNWNAKTKAFGPNGALLGAPINGNVQVLYYRKDLYEKKGLKVPQTWAELEANAEALHDDSTYGFVARGARDSILYNFTSYMFSNGGSFFKDPSKGDYTVTINSPAGLKALETYIKLAKTTGPANPGAVAQAELIQLLSTGRAAQAIGVVAAYSNLNDPNSSIVAGKIGTALIPAAPGQPHASAAGHWMAGIAKNVPEGNQKIAMNFLEWFLKKDQQMAYVKAGGVPVRSDLSEMSDSDPAFAFLPAFSENAKVAQMNMPLIQGVELGDAVSLQLNKALIGEISPKEALNTAAHQMQDILSKAGYKLTPPKDLK